MRVVIIGVVITGVVFRVGVDVVAGQGVKILHDDDLIGAGGCAVGVGECSQ